MITNNEQWHYIALKSLRTDDGFNRPTRSLSRLFRGVTSNNHGVSCCLICLHSFWTDNALKRHEWLCDNNDYCYVEMSTKNTNKLKYNHGEKWILRMLTNKTTILPKQSKWILYWKKSYAQTCGYALSLICSFDSNENKHNFYRRRDFIKRFCSDVKELGAKIIKYEQKDMIPLTDNETKFYEKQKKMLHMKKRDLLW